MRDTPSQRIILCNPNHFKTYPNPKKSGNSWHSLRARYRLPDPGGPHKINIGYGVSTLGRVLKETGHLESFSCFKYFELITLDLLALKPLQFSIQGSWFFWANYAQKEK